MRENRIRRLSGRIIASLLICAIIAGCIPYNNAGASNTYDDITIYQYGSYENPLYAGETDTNVAENIIPVVYSNSDTLSTYSSLVKYIRNCMVNRESSAAFTYTGDLSGLEAKVCIANAIKDAYSDNDNELPYEGDYIQFSFSKYSFSLSQAGNIVKVNLSLWYHTTAAQEAQVTEKVNSLLDSWDTAGMTELQKVRLVHDYIVNNVTYDYTYSKYSAYNALVEGSSVCQGYALATYRLLRELGVNVRIIRGYGNDERHAWNIVKVGERYYNIDCTWDSNLTSDGVTDYTYYLLSEDDFEGHTRDEEYYTDEFNIKHPMYIRSYFDEEGINVEAPLYSFNSTGGSKITPSGSKITILVMSRISDTNMIKLLNSIADKGLDTMSGVRVVAVDVNKTGKSSVASAISDISNDITACYDTGSTANNTMFDIAERVDILNSDGTVTIPVTVVIDTTNHIRYAYKGSGVTGGKLLNCIYAITPAAAPTEPPIPTAVPEASPTPGVEPTDEPVVKPTQTPDNPGTEPTQTPDNPGAEPTQTPDNPGAEPTQTPDNPGAEPTQTPDNPGAEPTQTPDNPGAEPTQTPDNPGAEATQTPDNPGAEPTQAPGTPGAEPTQAPGTPGVWTTRVPEQKPTQVLGTSGTEPTSTDNVASVGNTIIKSGLKYKVTAVEGSKTVKCIGAVKKQIKKVVIPDTVKYMNETYKVTMIDKTSFKNNRNISTLVIGKNVTTIKNKAFYGCRKLKKITIKGKKLKIIGYKAFAGISRSCVVKGSVKIKL